MHCIGSEQQSVYSGVQVEFSFFKYSTLDILFTPHHHHSSSTVHKFKFGRFWAVSTKKGSFPVKTGSKQNSSKPDVTKIRQNRGFHQIWTIFRQKWVHFRSRNRK